MQCNFRGHFINNSQPGIAVCWLMQLIIINSDYQYNKFGQDENESAFFFLNT